MRLLFKTLKGMVKMKDLFKKHWITLLGAVFIFMAFSYSFSYAVDKGWVSNEIRVGIGLLLSAGFIIYGITLHQKGKNLVGEIICGLGAALIYTTFSFAGIYYSMWSPMTVFLAMIAATLSLSIYAFKFNLRILMNIAIIGALISPIVMKSQGDQVFTLFLYLLVINSIFFFVSVSKRWLELRLMPFIGTWILFTVYYFYFNPLSWQTPFGYAVMAFIFYVAGFMISSWKEEKNFEGLNLYLGIANASVFLLWSLAILYGVMNYSIVLAGIGVVYLLVSLITYGISGRYSSDVLVKFFGGLLLLLIAGSEIGTGSEIKPIISVCLWTIVAAGVLIAGQIKSKDYLKLLSTGIWFAAGIYWFAVTWDTPLGIWFGTFIPILNWSGIAWVLLAVLGFYFSIKVDFDFVKKDKSGFDKKMLSNFFSISSHLIVGGLLTFQIDNLWNAYTINFVDLWLTLSFTWGIYALLLFLWGAYSKQPIFRWFGSAVLAVVAIKTIFFDLSNSEMIYKIIVLFILGILSFAISYINNMWKPEEPTDNLKVDRELESKLTEDSYNSYDNMDEEIWVNKYAD